MGGDDVVKATRTLLVMTVVATVVLCSAAAGASTSAGDETPPETTASALSHYAGDVSFTLHASDTEGVSYVYHRFDRGVVRLFVVPTDTAHPVVTVAVPTAKDSPLSLGRHTVRFWAQDVNGNVEAQNAAVFAVTPALTLTSRSAAVDAGRTIALAGTLRPAAAATVEVQSRRPGTVSFRAIAGVRTKPSGVYSYTCTTKTKGLWSFRVAFVDSETTLSAVSPVVRVRVK